jgi:hypothetical protein
MTAETILLTGIGTCLAIAAALIVMLAITFEQQDWKMKPHIRKIYGSWHCIGQGHFAFGPTPAGAYREWVNGFRNDPNRNPYRNMPPMSLDFGFWYP